MLRLHPRLAPYKVAVLPLSKKDTLTPLAQQVRKELSSRYMVDYDETQAIGQALPPPGRDRHAAVRHGRLRVARG